MILPDIEITMDAPDTLFENDSSVQRCFFDLEGSLTIAGDILQFGAILTDWAFNVTGVVNKYFRNYKPITPKEFSIHKLSSEFVWANSNGSFCESLAQLPLNPSISTMFISYTLFDVNRIQAEVRNYGLADISFGKEVNSLLTRPPNGSNCHYNIFKDGRKSGEKLAQEMGIERINKIFDELTPFGSYENKGNHDALFDCAMLLSLCKGMMGDVK